MIDAARCITPSGRMARPHRFQRKHAAIMSSPPLHDDTAFATPLANKDELPKSLRAAPCYLMTRHLIYDTNGIAESPCHMPSSNKYFDDRAAAAAIARRSQLRWRDALARLASFSRRLDAAVIIHSRAHAVSGAVAPISTSHTPLPF